MGKKKPKRKIHIHRAVDVPPSACPNCHFVLEVASSITDDGRPRTPRPGMLTLCGECSTPLMFTEQMTLRLATAEEARLWNEKNDQIVDILREGIAGVRAKDLAKGLLPDLAKKFRS